jgi:hypothetical protein
MEVRRMPEFAGPGTPIAEQDFAAIEQLTGAEPAAIWSILAVETAGCGFLPDRRPDILFERHYFSRLTGGKFDQIDPDVSNPVPGGYGPAGAHQYDRLAAAITLDRQAALRSASWGIGQIMGDNFAAAGYAGVEAMVEDFVAGEGAQLRGMARFLKSGGLDIALRDKNWAQLARGYNGPDYAARHYDSNLASFYQRFADGGMPDLAARAGQVWLRYAGFPLSADGQLGPATRRAVAAFQTQHQLPPSGEFDAPTMRMLSAVP